MTTLPGHFDGDQNQGSSAEVESLSITVSAGLNLPHLQDSAKSTYAEH